jgi:hypothetical protein
MERAISGSHVRKIVSDAVWPVSGVEQDTTCTPTTADCVIGEPCSCLLKRSSAHCIYINSRSSIWVSASSGDTKLRPQWQILYRVRQDLHIPQLVRQRSLRIDLDSLVWTCLEFSHVLERDISLSTLRWYSRPTMHSRLQGGSSTQLAPSEESKRYDRGPHSTTKSQDASSPRRSAPGASLHRSRPRVLLLDASFQPHPMNELNSMMLDSATISITLVASRTAAHACLVLANWTAEQQIIPILEERLLACFGQSRHRHSRKSYGRATLVATERTARIADES